MVTVMEDFWFRFGFTPRTFVLPHDLKSLRTAWEKTGQDKWIIKPVSEKLRILLSILI